MYTINQVCTVQLSVRLASLVIMEAQLRDLSKPLEHVTPVWYRED